MRVLFATGTAAAYMMPPLLGDEQIVCGPDWTDARDAKGRTMSLQTPVGEYDIATILAKLGADEQPDVIVALVDASWRNAPRNLGCFGGIKALLIADTHHMQSPLLGMVRYMASEVYDRFVFLYDRHHLDFFRAAGLPNLHWFPGLTFPHSDAVVRAARTRKREQRIAFVGQTGNFHPRRGRMLAALEEAGLPMAVKALAQKDALPFYGRSLVGFNASLNGDLNLRVFEILASGAMLLTDRLGVGSGMDQLLGETREFVGYGTAEELAERAAHALAHPAQAAAIGAAGAAWFDTHFNETRRRTAFLDLLFNNRDLPEFSCAESITRVSFGGNTDRLLQAMMVYEGVQELHRKQESVEVALDAAVPTDVEAMFTTLPRLRVVRDVPAPAADIAVFSRADVETGLDNAVSRLWCWDAEPEDFSVLAERFDPAGYDLVSNDVAVLCARPPAVASSGSAPVRVMLFTDDPDSGGVAQYNHSLLVGLAAAGYHVSCAQTESANPLVQRQRELGVVHHWIPYDTKREFARTLQDQATAARLFMQSRPDFLIFSDCCPLSNLAAREVARKVGIPYISVVGFVGAYLADRFAPQLPILAQQYAAARAVVAVSEENLALLRSHFGLSRDAGQVIHYGRPAKFFLPADATQRATLRQSIGLPSDAVLCFTAARLAAVKGYLYQIEAAKHLAKLPGGHRIHFAWAGEGEQRAELEAAISAAGLNGRIHLLGQRWDVERWYDAADIFVLPSDLEGMPLAIMEAMAKGLPVVATAVSGIPEELGETGQLLPAANRDLPGLVRQLVRTVHTWATQPALRRSVGQACQARAQAMFREDAMIERTLSLVQLHTAELQSAPMEEPAALSA